MAELPRSFTQTLRQVQGGEDQASEDLWAMVYDELRRLAHYRLGLSRPGKTLGTTMLVHEVFIRIGDSVADKIKDQQHFMALSAMAMRQIIVAYIREHSTLKREHDAVPYEDELAGEEMPHNDVLAIDDALIRLKAVDENLVQVVECRFFGGLTTEETAQALDIKPRRVIRQWAKARLFLAKAITETTLP